MNRLAWLFLLVILGCHSALADPFLEPETLPANLRQLNFEDSQSGNSILVQLDDNHLPIKQGFFGDGVSIPFYIEGFLVDHSEVTWPWLSRQGMQPKLMGW
jgi:hypothetical protein